MMKVRHGHNYDLETVMGIYYIARKHMRESGNANQWVNGYPSKSLIQQDIDDGNFYVITDMTDKKIYGCFTFIIGKDPTYEYIEGEWLNDRIYGTIHRIASTGVKGGIVRKACEYALIRVKNLRIDTHEDNKEMQHVVEKFGFKRCGIIYVEDGSPRVAYHFENTQGAGKKNNTIGMILVVIGAILGLGGSLMALFTEIESIKLLAVVAAGVFMFKAGADLRKKDAI